MGAKKQCEGSVKTILRIYPNIYAVILTKKPQKISSKTSTLNAKYAFYTYNKVDFT